MGSLAIVLSQFACLVISVAATTLPSQAPLRDTENVSIRPALLTTLERLRLSQPLSDVKSLSESIKFHTPELDTFTASPPSNQDAAAALACDLSRAIIGSENVIDQNSETYFEEISSNWSQNCHLPAACILKVQNPSQIALVLQLVRKSGSKFAIRSGGTNPNPGFGSITSGVLIDVANMNSMSLNGNKSIVSVGPGARWGSVYKFLEPYNISAVGARSPIPGVSGYLAGGGLPFIPNLTGFGCDNVQNFELVLGNSTIINANASANADLFFALKGGASNYGIVTRYDLYTSTLHELWYRFDLFHEADHKAVLEATIKSQKAMENDNGAHLIIVTSGHMFLVGRVHAGWGSPPAVFEAFEHINPAVSFIAEANGTVYSLSQELNFLYSTKATREIFGISYLIDQDYYMRTFDTYASLTNFSTTPGTDLSYTIQPIGKAAVEYGIARGGNPLGLKAVEQTWFNSVVQYAELDDAAPARHSLEQLKASMEQDAKENGLLLPFIFENDASAIEEQNPFASYGAENLAKLKAASEKYDPERIFQETQYGGFKVLEA